MRSAGYIERVLTLVVCGLIMWFVGDDRLDQNTFLSPARMVDGGPDGPIGDRCSPHEGSWSMNCEIEEPGDFACPAAASDSDPSYL